MTIDAYVLEAAEGASPFTKVFVEVHPNTGSCPVIHASATVNGVPMRAFGGSFRHDDGSPGPFEGPHAPADTCSSPSYVLDHPGPEVTTALFTEIRLEDESGEVVLRTRNAFTPPTVSVDSPSPLTAGQLARVELDERFTDPVAVRYVRSAWTPEHEGFVIESSAFEIRDGALTFTVPSGVDGSSGTLFIEARRDVQGRPHWRLRMTDCVGAASCSAARRSEPNENAVAPESDAPLDRDPWVEVTVR